MNRREFLRLGAIAGGEAALAAVAALNQTESAAGQAEKTVSTVPANWTEGGISWALTATETLPAENPAEGMAGTFSIIINEVLYLPGNWGTAKLIADMSPVGLSIFFEPKVEQPLYPIVIPETFSQGALWQLGVAEYPEGELELSNLQEIRVFTNEAEFTTDSLGNVRRVLEATGYQGAALYIVDKEIVVIPAVIVTPPQEWGTTAENKVFTVQPGQTISKEYVPTHSTYAVSVNDVLFEHLTWAQVMQVVGNPSKDGAAVFVEQKVTEPTITEVTPPKNWGSSDTNRIFTIGVNERISPEFSPETTGDFDVSIGDTLFNKLHWDQVQSLLSLSTVGATIWYTPISSVYLPTISG